MQKLLFAIAIPLFLISCSAEDPLIPRGGSNALLQLAPNSPLDLPPAAFDYTPDRLPAHFFDAAVIAADNTPANNETTDWGATLGRVLFYEKALSKNQTVSCGSCHIQENGFSDPAQLSLGFDGGRTGRNSMGLANAAYYSNGHFFWDERAITLEDQVLGPIQNEVEMGMTLDEVLVRLKDLDYYQPLFLRAFGDSDITVDRISKALAQFVRSMISYRTKYDKGREQVNGPEDEFPNFNAKENLGKRLFFDPQAANCAVCHSTDLFFVNSPANIGLGRETVDPGIGGITGNPLEMGQFKVPSLRNIAVTGPYMHDGRFRKLEDVVDFYNQEVQAHPNLDSRLQRDGNPQRLNLNREERNALVAFLKTLTDEEMKRDPKFSDPFRPRL